MAALGYRSSHPSKGNCDNPIRCLVPGRPRDRHAGVLRQIRSRFEAPGRGTGSRPPPEGADRVRPRCPDPAQIQRGVVALSTAVRISTLLPGEQEAIFSILRSLNTADELLPRLVGQPGWDAYPARLLVAIVDNDRRELANLGR